MPERLDRYEQSRVLLYKVHVAVHCVCIRVVQLLDYFYYLGLDSGRVQAYNATADIPTFYHLSNIHLFSADIHIFLDYPLILRSAIGMSI